MRYLKTYEERVTIEENPIGKNYIFTVYNDELEEFFEYLVRLETEPRAFIIPEESKYLWQNKDILILFKFQSNVPDFIINRSFGAWKLNSYTLEDLTKEEITDVDLYLATNKYNL